MRRKGDNMIKIDVRTEFTTTHEWLSWRIYIGNYKILKRIPFSKRVIYTDPLENKCIDLIRYCWPKGCWRGTVNMQYVLRYIAPIRDQLKKNGRLL